MDRLLSVLQTTPLNVLLLIPIGYLLYDVLFPRALLAPGTPIPSSYEESYLWRPKAHMPVTVWKKYSPQTLEGFSGKKNGRILLAIDRVVYDVTAGRSFYGPGDCSDCVRV
jgi:membrane-associated progesterone receptor component